MTQVELPFTLKCPDPHHKGHVIVMLNVDPDTKKIGYCPMCIEESDKEGVIIKTRRSVSSFLDDCSNFYEKCRQRVPDAVQHPTEYIEELSETGECLEQTFSQYMNQERDSIKRSFIEIRRMVDQVINEKEKECLGLVDKEISEFSKAYRKFEKLLMMTWPRPSDIQNIFPGTDVLEQKMAQIENMDQLRAFMEGVHEDIQVQNEYFKEEGGVSQIKKKLDGLICSFSIPEDSLPKIQSQILNLETMENLMRDFMKGFIQQEVKVENSFGSRMKALTYESKIISDGQFITLKDWLPQGYKFDLELLYRGSVDGMSAEKFHEKCDGKGATITLVKCRFDGAQGCQTIGGFIDQSWHSKGSYSSSKEAFLFSLAEQSCHSVKCPILESQFAHASYGGSQDGPLFGGGYDLYLHNGLKTGAIVPNSYSNAIALCNGYGDTFNTEEIEIFQVQ